MMTLPAFSRRARWAVPAGAVAVVAAVAAASAITVAQAAPELPARTPAQLLAAVAGQRSAPPPLTGTVVETASLGIPQLPGAANPDSITSLLAGPHTIRVWYGGPTQVRLAVPVQMGETDFIRNGGTAWLWQSSSNTATRLLIPVSRFRERHLNASLPTPQQAAQRVLAAVGPTTRVSTQSNVVVAGQPAYQLVLAPRDSRSLIGKVTLALDGQHLGVVLRVQVFARGASSPAIQIGYTSISFVRPASANFTFTPPAGAKVRTLLAPGSGWAGAVPRCGWIGVPPPGPGSAGRLPQHARLIPVPRFRNGQQVPAPPCLRASIPLRPGWIGGLPRHARLVVPPPAFRNEQPVPIPRRLLVPGRPGMHSWLMPGHPPLPGLAPQVVGKGWLSVLVMPAPAMPWLAGPAGSAAAAAGQAARSVSGGGPVSNPAIMGALLKSARPVHGSWGSGRLLHTSLVSILMTSNGRVLIGAVDPSVLYAAAVRVK